MIGRVQIFASRRRKLTESGDGTARGSGEGAGGDGTMRSCTGPTFVGLDLFTSPPLSLSLSHRRRHALQA